MALTKENKPINGAGIKHLWSKIVSLFAKKTDIDSLLTSKGQPNGLATLDSSGRVPSSQLPSYVDDVLEYDNKTAFPATGEAGKIYVSKNDNKTWRWSGSDYVEISASLAIGTTTGTAYDGGKGFALETKVNTLEGRVDTNEEVLVEKLNKADTNYSIEGMSSGLKITTGSVEYTFEDDGTLSIGEEQVATYQDVLDNTANKVDKSAGSGENSSRIDINANSVLIEHTNVGVGDGTIGVDQYGTPYAEYLDEASTNRYHYSFGSEFTKKTGNGTPYEILDASMFLSTSEIDELCQ